MAEKERQVRTEANMLNEFKQSLDKEAVERDTVKEQVRQLMIHNSQLKEYGRLEVESFNRTIQLLRDENSSQRQELDESQSFLRQLNDDNENLHNELETAKTASRTEPQGATEKVNPPLGASQASAKKPASPAAERPATANVEDTQQAERPPHPLWWTMVKCQFCPDSTVWATKLHYIRRCRACNTEWHLSIPEGMFQRLH